MRKYITFFVGQRRPDYGFDTAGEKVDKLIKKYPLWSNRSSVMQIAMGWNSGSLKNIDDYRGAVMNSVFLFCPWGVNPETYRLSETLEAGAIPLVSFKRGEWHPHWMTMPGIVVESWDSVPRVLEELFSQDPTGANVNFLQSKTIEWWQNWKESIRQDITDKLTDILE